MRLRPACATVSVAIALVLATPAPALLADADPTHAITAGHAQSAGRALYRCARCKHPMGDGDRVMGHTLCLPCRSRSAIAARLLAATTVPPRP